MRRFHIDLSLASLAALGLTGVMACGSTGSSGGADPGATAQPPGEAQEGLARRPAGMQQDTPEASKRDGGSQRDGDAGERGARPAWCNGITADGGCTFLH